MNESGLLNSTYKGAKMGCEEINHILSLTQDTSLKNVLKNEFEEYKKIVDSADTIAKQNGIQTNDIGVIGKMSSYITTSMETLTDKSSSHIADMVIKGTTMGITQINKDINSYNGNDKKVLDLANKLVQTQQSNIEDMKSFL